MRPLGSTFLIFKYCNIITSHFYAQCILLHRLPFIILNDGWGFSWCVWGARGESRICLHFHIAYGDFGVVENIGSQCVAIFSNTKTSNCRGVPRSFRAAALPRLSFLSFLSALRRHASGVTVLWSRWRQRYGGCHGQGCHGQGSTASPSSLPAPAPSALPSTGALEKVKLTPWKKTHFQSNRWTNQAKTGTNFNQNNTFSIFAAAMQQWNSLWP